MHGQPAGIKASMGSEGQKLARARENKYHSYLGSPSAILFSTSLPYFHISFSASPCNTQTHTSLTPQAKLGFCGKSIPW
jgi:hypothetical protein